MGMSTMSTTRNILKPLYTKKTRKGYKHQLQTIDYLCKDNN